jgi:colanic acid/amylovoran biosynthesis glycosyltransferase
MKPFITCCEQVVFEGWAMDREKRRATPEVTVVMPVYNCERYIGGAIQSILEQDGVDLELFVVNDASTDGSEKVVESFQDPRIRLITNHRRMGDAYCYNLVSAERASPFIAHVEADGLVLPGAFRRMLEEYGRSREIGQVHSYFFEIDEAGWSTRESYYRHRESLLTHLKPAMDYRKALLVSGPIPNYCRMYRREVFGTVGTFDEESLGGAVYDMDLRIVDRFEMRCVPEFLYCRRVCTNSREKAQGVEALVNWIRRLLYLRQVRKTHTIGFLKQPSYSQTRLLLPSLYRALECEALVRWQSRARRIVTHIQGLASLRGWVPLFKRMCYQSITRFTWWPIELLHVANKIPPRGEKLIGYYIWNFPTLRQTFIRREVRALKKSGVAITVIAHGSDDAVLLGEDAKSFQEITQYPFPMNQTLLSKYHRMLFRKNPLAYLNLLVFIMSRRYGPHKSLRQDADVFTAAVYLAGLLKEADINHVHSPWADYCAFIALLASKLLGVPFSVQVRAHDLHRTSYPYRFALREIFENAEFIITNSRYNRPYISSFLTRRRTPRIYTIYNGVNLSELDPGEREWKSGDVTQILCVAALIEPKGLVYLLEACALLRERGSPVTCEIIGGPEEPLYTNYLITLKKTHRRLGLQDCVVFRGPQPFARVLEAYRTADVFILPCVEAQDGHRDITPNALIEAMAMKLPVVSTTITAIPEIVQDGVSGLLVRPRDAHALADAIQKLIGDPLLRRELGESARMRIEERFDSNKNIHQYVELFSSSEQRSPMSDTSG